MNRSYHLRGKRPSYHLLAAGLAVLFASPFARSEAGDSISPDAFANPPLSARPRAYWDWVNGAVDLKQLTRDLEEMHAKGMGGGEMWDTGALRNPNGMVPAGPAFLGPESVEAIHHSLKEAKRLGLELGLVTSSGWNAGGSWVTPEWAGKNVYVATITVEGPAAINQALPFPEVPEKCPKGPDGLPLYHRDVAVLAVPGNADKVIAGPSAVLNLSDHTTEGTLQWDAPAGPWTILRFVCTNNGQTLIAPSPNSDGLLIDFLDPDATRMHFQYMLDRLGVTPENAAELGLKYFEVDSMELEPGIQWTDDFVEYFQSHIGYDPTPWLPVLAGWTIQSADESGRFLYDYKKAVSDLLIFSHYTTGSEMLRRYGMEFNGEAGGPGPPIWATCPVDALKALGNVDVPRGEFWIRHRNMFLVKEISSASHIYGKPIVDAESFTTWRRWKDSPFIFKQAADRAFCEGLNRITFHGFVHSPEEAGIPGRAYHAGADINPRVTWWEQARPFIDYLARCSYMLQQGKFVADVCYFYGDQAPNFYPEFHDVPGKPLLEGLGKGYDYDVVNSDVILNRMSVQDGRIALPDGMSYAALMLRDQSQMPLEVLEKIESMVKAGATIIGPKPLTVPGLLDHEEKSRRLQELAASLWGPCDGNSVTSNSYGKGTVHWGVSPRDVLRQAGLIEDFQYASTSGEPGLDYIHRRVGDTDVYFVRNPSSSWANADCVFRVTDKSPEEWSPDSGAIRRLWTYTAHDGGTSVPLSLAPGAATFIVFRPHDGKDGHTAVARVTGPSGAPPAEVVACTQTAADLLAWVDGAYRVVMSDGARFEAQVSGISGPQVVPGAWELHFPEKWGAPPMAVFDSLHSWADDADQGIKYFSGKATYKKVLQVAPALLESGHRLYLDLGAVADLAEVRLNGKSLGILWKEPFRVDITEAAVAGDNALEVDVTNMWINRLSGDLLLPEVQRFCRTNDVPRTKDIGGDEPWRAQLAGLLGPVRLTGARLVHAGRP
ncbi:MAG: hypothetical protein IT364_08260 [Candidatus Hydrogenedentes bacterium]|nr:hypothetical protein [Candidatus Hydrogenedentota bacterium]